MSEHGPLSIVALSYDDPWGSQHGGNRRTRSLLRSLVASGHEVHVVFPTGESVDERRDGIEAHGVATTIPGEGNGAGRLRSVKRELLPMPTTRGGRNADLRARVADFRGADVVLVSQLRGMAYREALPGARLWFDQLDLWSEFCAAEVARRSGIARRTARMQHRVIARAERRAARGAWRLSAAGWGDARRLEAMSGQDVAWLPMSFDVPRVREPGGTARGFGLLANFGFWPNAHAFGLLSRNWLPGLADGHDVVVAGHGADRLPETVGVRNMGPLQHVDAFYDEVDVCLAPIGLGAGIKVKIIEALMRGKAVAASEFALRGFPPELRALVPPMPLDRWDAGVLREVLARREHAAALAADLFSHDAFDRRVKEAVQGAA